MPVSPHARADASPAVAPGRYRAGLPLPADRAARPLLVQQPRTPGLPIVGLTLDWYHRALNEPGPARGGLELGGRGVAGGRARDDHRHDGRLPARPGPHPLPGRRAGGRDPADHAAGHAAGHRHPHLHAAGARPAALAPDRRGRASRPHRARSSSSSSLRASRASTATWNGPPPTSAPTRSRTVRYVILPLIWPAVLAGALISVTLSIDEFVVTFFTVGPQLTLPLYIYTQIKFGVTPEVNAIATVMLGVTLALLLLAGADPGGARSAAVARRGRLMLAAVFAGPGPARHGGPAEADDRGGGRRPRRGRGLRHLRHGPSDPERAARPSGDARHDHGTRARRTGGGRRGRRRRPRRRHARDHRPRPQVRELRLLPRGPAGELPQRRRARHLPRRRISRATCSPQRRPPTRSRTRSPPAIAALAEPLACVVNGTRKAGARPGQSVLIFGAGAIGCLFLAVFRASGCAPIIVVEPSAGACRRRPGDGCRRGRGARSPRQQ